jgi:hypothetical protein
MNNNLNEPNVYLKIQLDKKLKELKLDNLIYSANFQFTYKNILGEDKFTYDKYVEELKEIGKLVKTICPYQTVRVMGVFEQAAHLKGYESDLYNICDIKVKKSKVKTKKFAEQRLPNTSKTRKIDNFRYALEIATRSASPMLTPYGFITDKLEYSGMLCQIDRSNLDEFLSRNVLPTLKLDDTSLSSKKDFDIFSKSDHVLETITKSQLIEIHTEFSAKLDDMGGENIFWAEILKKIKDDSANAEYTLMELLEHDPMVVDSLLNSIRLQETIIGRYSVVSRELEKINNKGNIWMPINYEFRKVFSKIGLSIVKVIMGIQKTSDYNKYLKLDNDTFKKFIDKAAEHVLLPNLALDIWSSKKFIVSSSNVSTESQQNYHNFVEFLECKQMEHISDYYSNLSELNEEDFKSNMNLELINNMFSGDVNKVIDKYKSKLKKLKDLIDVKAHPEYAIAQAKIDKIRNQTYGTNPLVILAILNTLRFPNGSKMLLEKDNVVKIVDMFFRTFFGDDSFIINKKTKDGYTIKCTALEQYLLEPTKFGGSPNSHHGRATLFLDKTKNQQFRSFYDDEFDGDSNKKFTKEKLAELKTIIDRISCVWYEYDHSGKSVACGYTEEGKVMGTSAEHLDNTTNTSRVLRAVAPNSAEGRIHKTITNPSDWYDHMANIQPKFEKQHGDTIKMNRVINDLKAYANYLRGCGE